ncbi:DUF2510 domain-containing protein [Conyzicola sp.]|uniref:DUF2510 domain-containing protein n=1 Tax=Conyzicola sp. TaxID=1969404 RepID=UPI003988D337
MTEPSYAPIPAGWYPDPRGSRQRRWWDGTAWTHALEPLAHPVAPPAPGYAHLPGPQIRVPSPSAPTVNRAIYSESRAARAVEATPPVAAVARQALAGHELAVQALAGQVLTRRQLRDAEAAAEAQRTLPETVSPTVSPPANYAMGPAVSSTQQPRASFAPEQFRTAEAQQPEQQLTEQQLTDQLVGAPAQTLAPSTSGPAGASTTFSPAAVGPVAPASSPLPVEPATVPASNPVLSIGPAYQPFGMTPKITTGVMEAPTSVNTSSVWLITVLPAFGLAVAVALIRFAPEFYTPFTQGALVFVFAIAGIALALQDRKQLTLRSHQDTASPAWILLTPLAYLVARAVHTSRQAGRGWAPALTFLLLTGAATALVVFSGLPIGTFVVL